MTSAVAADLLQTGSLQHHISNVLQPAYASRYRGMMSAIEQHLLPLGVWLPQTGRESVGGYFIWFALPRPLQAVDVTRRAQEQANLIVAQGALFEVPGDSAEITFPDCIRLCFAWEDEHKLAEGIERLAAVIREMQRDDEMSRDGDNFAV